MKKTLTNFKFSLFLLVVLPLLLVNLQVFGQTFQNKTYSYGLVPTNRSTSDAASSYSTWKSTYIETCSDGSMRVRFDTPSQTVSEGIGYGMLLSAYAGDRTLFDGLWKYYRRSDFTNSNGFMHWKTNGCSGVAAQNSATDAEFDVAMSLIVASYLWGGTYGSDAKTLIGKIKSKEIDGSSVVKPGDMFGGSNLTNPSYFAPGYFRVFGSFTNDASYWNGVASKAYQVINANLSSHSAAGGLVSDWCNSSGAYSSDASGYYQSGQKYHYDAARTPWRIAVDYIWHGNSDAQSYVKKSSDFVRVTLGGTKNIKDGYNQNGTAYGQWHNNTFVAPFACAAMGGGDQTHLNDSYADVVSITENNYFNYTIRTMALFLMTGNFYLPGGTSNPTNVSPTVSITSPANNATFTAPASITINANAADSDGSVSKVDFYNGSTLLGSDASSPYSYVWSNVAAGTYTITAKATDNAGAVTTSSAITVVVGAANTAPTVSITSPSNNASFTAPASITINANASDADGTISNVSFYNGSTLLGSDASSPYSYVWTNVAAGTYTITAKATDNAGAVTTSTAITVVVNTVPNVVPTVSITSPANNATFSAPASITINATASDADGTISSVGFYNGSTLLGSDASSPYSFVWNNVAAGTYTLTARATDNSGAVTTSSNVTVVVNTVPNVLPTVSITSPANNATFSAPGSITINATASDADGTISSVAFYNGSTLLGSDASSPYSFVWNNVAAGTYTITARATDNSGGVTTSSSITVVVNTVPNVAPTVSITSPANNATFTAPASITINANATDSDGSITTVAFYNGSTLIGSDASSPYSFIWNNVAAGTYTITAVATDNSGATTTASAIAITVNPAPPSTVIQGESACTVDGVLNETANTGYRGTGYLNTDDVIGASASWSVNSQTAQTIDLGIRYATGTSTGRPMSLSVNGTTQVANIAFAFTGGSTSWAVTTVQVSLAAGANTIRLVSLAAIGSPYLDELSFASITVSAGSCTANNTLPTVSITSPANNASFAAPASITINANAADADGTVSSVAFYNGSTLLGSDASAPYSFSWANVAAGTYTLTAKATDNSGGVTTSSAITVVVNTSVNTPPTVSITSPANNASFTAPASITINASASDANGTVTSVDFYNGSTLLGSDATSPYSYSWTNVAAGTYTITARATDNGGAVTTSSAITIVVNGSNSGAVTIQGETACSVDGTLNETYNSGFRGTGYVNTTDAVGAGASWSVNSSSAQSVSLGIRYATATAAGRPMSLSVNGTTQVANIAFANTGGVSSWVVTTVQINLAAGVNTIQFTSLTAEGSPYLDELTFGSATVSAASCTSAATFTIQGEEACSVDGTLNESANSGFRGTGYVNTTDAVGAGASWSVNSSSAQSVSLGIRYATATASGRPMSLSVNGTIQVANIAFANTGGITSWEVTNVQISLAAGVNTIHLSALTAEGSPYLDELIFGSSTVSAASCASTAGTFTIQGENACSVDGTLNESYNSGFKGTGYANTNDAVGASATYSINSTSAQTVSLGIRYATATTAGRPMSLLLNGTTQIANIPFANTGGMTVWVVTTVQINLAAGTNTIKLSSLTAEGSPYLDELTFGSTTVSAGSCANLGMAAAAAPLQSTVGPNPSSDVFTISALESVESFTVVNSQGLVVYSGGSIAAAESVTFGEKLESGLYILWIHYSNGTVENKKIQKTL